jgi:septum site-determining protein MinD
MALADTHDVTIIDADTGMANILFHAGLADVETTLHDVLAGTARTSEAVYDRFGMDVVPCGTSLAGFREADPDRLQDVVATLAADTDVILLDSAATLGNRAAVLPIVLADRIVVVLQPTIPSLSDGLKVQEYATTYDTGVAGTVFNRVTDDANIDAIAERPAGTSRARRWQRYPKAMLFVPHGGPESHCSHTLLRRKLRPPTERQPSDWTSSTASPTP